MAFSKDDTKIMKGLAILLMLFHHLFAFPERINDNISYFSFLKIGDNTLSYYIAEFGQICVAIFIFLAGYGLYISSSKKGIKNLSSYLKDKLISLYKIFWKVFIIVIPISILLKVDIINTSIESLILNFTGINITYNNEWWFFTPYVMIILSFPLLKRVIDRKNSEWIYDLFLIAIFNEFVTFMMPYIFKYPIFSYFKYSFIFDSFQQFLVLLPTFFTGCVFAKYDLLSSIKTKFSQNYLYSIIAVIIIVGSIYMRHITGDFYDYIYTVLIIGSFSVILSGKRFKLINKCLKELGLYSAAIWLVHSFFCYLWCQELVYWPRYSLLIFINLILISYATSILIALFYNMLGNLLNKLKNKLVYK